MLRRWLMLLGALLLAACSGEPDDPEARLRAAIAEAEAAVEGRELKKAAGYVAPDYKDASGRNARAVRQLLLGYLHRNRNIHLLSRIAELEMSEDTKVAEVRLYVAMAGTPVQSFEALVSVNADLHRFDLQFVDGEEGWKLVSARWQRATLADVLE